LEDYVSFDNAIEEALKTLNLDETQVVVTADHSHTMTLGGWPQRGASVFALSLNSRSNTSDFMNVTFTSLSYGFTFNVIEKKSFLLSLIQTFFFR
jgi:alkaline phosphatase